MYRIDALIKGERKLFHTRDLALLWEIEKENTLYTQIKRYVKKGVLIPIHKGFYSTVPLEKINPILLGISCLHQYGYLSCEYVLAQEGVIFQQSSYITLLSSISKKFTLASNNFLVRKLKEAFLYNDFGIEETDGYKKANLERAVTDILYFNPHYNFDNPKIIDWGKVAKVQKGVGYR